MCVCVCVRRVCSGTGAQSTVYIWLLFNSYQTLDINHINKRFLHPVTVLKKNDGLIFNKSKDLKLLTVLVNPFPVCQPFKNGSREINSY